MVQLCFVLDLRSLAPPLLRDIKQVQSWLCTINFVFAIISTSMHLTIALLSELCNSTIPNRSTISEFSCLNFQSLLQLANFYAISSSSKSHVRKSATLGDKIGLCYVFKNRLSSSNEVFLLNWSYLSLIHELVYNFECTSTMCAMIPASEFKRVN